MRRTSEKAALALDQEDRERFLTGRRDAVAATSRPNGPPRVTTVWHLWAGQGVDISTRRDRYMNRNLWSAHCMFGLSGQEWKTLLVATVAPVISAQAVVRLPITFARGGAVGTVTTVEDQVIKPLA